MANRLVKSFGYAFTGIATLFKETPNAKIHLLAAIVVIIAGLYLNVSNIEWAVLTLCIGFVITAEALNTALETLTDLASPEIHPLAKKTKDMAAGAVLIAAIISIIIAFLIFFPKILLLF